jgi:hypothetical protein
MSSFGSIFIKDLPTIGDLFFEMGSGGGDLYPKHEVNNVTPCNILRIKHWIEAGA